GIFNPGIFVTLVSSIVVQHVDHARRDIGKGRGPQHRAVLQGQHVAADRGSGADGAAQRLLGRLILVEGPKATRRGGRAFHLRRGGLFGIREFGRKRLSQGWLWARRWGIGGRRQRREQGRHVGQNGRGIVRGSRSRGDDGCSRSIELRQRSRRYIDGFGRRA